MSHQSTRRDFLKESTAVGVAFWVGGSSLSAQERSPIERVNVACIGIGGKGDGDCSQTASVGGNIVAICDIDDTKLDKKAKQFPKAARYHDFREMLDVLDRSIDAVVVSTPDHTHAPACMMAIRKGKHVYCQKPLTHSVYEARMLREATEKHKVVTQMGNQGTAAERLRRNVEIIQAGAIGGVREAHVWTDRPVWGQAPSLVARPSDTPPVPSTVHWDLFLGPAPERPYHPVYHPFAWRGWWDFGTGALGDMACHMMNLPYMALKLAYPTSVVAESGEINSETFPAWSTISYEFPARGDLPAVKFVWYDGKKLNAEKTEVRNLPPAELAQGVPFDKNGFILIGDKGTMVSSGEQNARYRLLPEKDFEGYQGPPPSLPRITAGRGNDDANQKREWIQAIKGAGPAPMSNFGHAALLTETVLLGNVATRAGKKIEWDGPNMRVTNAPEAAQYLKREYRQGWVL